MGLVLATFQEKKIVPILFNFHRVEIGAILANHNGKENKSQDRCQGQEAKTRGKITIETRETPEAVELVVTDNGIGIPKENQQKIFDPFFTTKDVGSGTGLGLAVSFGILKRHNATISVNSVPGKSTTFTVRFMPPSVESVKRQPRKSRSSFKTSL